MMFFVDKTSNMNVGEGAIYSLVAVLMVFAILILIIAFTSLVAKLSNLFSKKNKKENKPKEDSASSEIVIEDDNMMAAILVATIDYQNEIKKDVRVVSVKKVN